MRVRAEAVQYTIANAGTPKASAEPQQSFHMNKLEED